MPPKRPRNFSANRVNTLYFRMEHQDKILKAKYSFGVLPNLACLRYLTSPTLFKDRCIGDEGSGSYTSSSWSDQNQQRILGEMPRRSSFCGGIQATRFPEMPQQNFVTRNVVEETVQGVDKTTVKQL